MALAATLSPPSSPSFGFFPTSPSSSSSYFATSSSVKFPSPLRISSNATPYPQLGVMNHSNFSSSSSSRTLSPPASPHRRSQIKSGPSTPSGLKETLKRQCLAKMKRSRLDQVDKARGGVDASTASPSKNDMEILIRDQWSVVRRGRGRSMLATEELSGDDYIEIMQYLEEALLKDLQQEEEDPEARLYEESLHFDEQELEYLARTHFGEEDTTTTTFSNEGEAGSEMGLVEEYSQEMLDAIDEAEANYTSQASSWNTSFK